MRFKVGDKVIIRKPIGDHIYDSPRWVHHMDKLDGDTFEIDSDSIDTDTGYVRHGGWLFNQDWLERASTEDDVEENINPQDMSLLF